VTTLVTGGAGFIGSHVAARLLARGEPCVVLDDFNDYYDPALKRANAEQLAASDAVVVEGDVRDEAVVERIFAEHAVRRVVHLAALAGVRASIERTLLYLSVNTLGTATLLEAARRHRSEIFVFGSTSSVYGKTERLPFREDDAADRPLASYPASKRSAEILAHSYTHLFGLPVTVLRFFNVYGPAGRPDMMPLRVMQAVCDGTEIPVFNRGELERDWTYVEDTVDGVLAALERPLGYEVINLGVRSPTATTARRAGCSASTPGSGWPRAWSAPGTGFGASRRAEREVRSTRIQRPAGLPRLPRHHDLRLEALA
jgi:UDP-glucuronate 4-epimerase